MAVNNAGVASTARLATSLYSRAGAQRRTDADMRARLEVGRLGKRRTNRTTEKYMPCDGREG